MSNVPEGFKACSFEEATQGCWQPKDLRLCMEDDGVLYFYSNDADSVTWLCPLSNGSPVRGTEKGE